jgi:hypothetical protein
MTASCLDESNAPELVRETAKNDFDKPEIQTIKTFKSKSFTKRSYFYLECRLRTKATSQIPTFVPSQPPRLTPRTKSAAKIASIPMLKA